ncbi:50S ribosomal protein L32 [Candidatus Ecksteinia adelgidicola]|nr:50S ribosomal protein L32 [Candidatus Ecksteinia adelgidicola]
MAVQKNKPTRSKRGMRRAHDSIKIITLSTDIKSGEIHRRHHMTINNFYRGRKIID